MTNALRSLWAEPRVPDAPRRVWRDWVLVAAIAVAIVLEGALRDDVVWRPLAVAVCLALVPTVLFRRTHPLVAVAVAFGTGLVLTVASYVADVPPVGLNSTAFVIVLVYALLRWGSGREAGIGLAIMLVTYVVAIVGDWTGVGNAIGALVFLLFPAVLGALVRYASTNRQRERERVRLHERELLARELHDTVAHHVSAITIRAQAGRVLSASDPSAAVDALDVIEQEATRALTEMRLMVGVLRDGGTPDLAPQPGVADIERLAEDVVPPVDVELSGDLAEVGSSLQVALYRIAQESITNAVRHARNATRVEVRVAAERHVVRLTVADDGEAVSTHADGVGYGIVGMAERAALLGGTLDAGPGESRGWTVRAVLPRSGALR